MKKAVILFNLGGPDKLEMLSLFYLIYLTIQQLLAYQHF